MAADIRDLLDFIEGIGFDDETLFRHRQQLVAEAALDEATIVAHAGFLAADRVCFAGTRFDRDIRGLDPEPALIIGALDHAEKLFDLVAWPIVRPTHIGTLGGHVSMLGEAQAWAHPVTAFSPPLPVWRTPLAWLKSGFVGCVPIGREASARILAEVAGPILAEDDAHGRELDAARRELFRRAPQILVAAAA